MNRKMIAFLSTTVTVFILGAAVVIYQDVSASRLAEKNNLEISEDIQDQIQEREEAYLEVIEEANNRIEALNQEIQELQGGDSVLEVSEEKLIGDTYIRPDEAAVIALELIDYQEPLLNLPELVEFEGKVVYEIKVSSGVLYLDAMTGELVFNGIPEKINADQAAIIAGEYLGGMDPRYSQVKLVTLNGSEVFQAVFNNYMVYLDQFGNVLQAQVLQYDVSHSASVSQSDDSSGSYHDDDDYEDEHDEEDEEDDDD